MVFRHVVYSPFSAILLIILFCKYNWCPYISKLLLFFWKRINQYVVGPYAILYAIYSEFSIWISKYICNIFNAGWLINWESYIIKLLYHPIESKIELRLNNRNQLTVQSTIENQ